ncbi:MAG: AMP-binding protein [Anaerolineae bacterium]|nr:AMP-binding protein [Anaerolineae bacterium]
MKNTRTLIQPVIQRAQQDPERVTLVFIAEDGREEIVTAGQFHGEASGYAQALSELGIGAEDLVILVLRHSKVLLSAFWGALYLGAIPSIFPFLTEKLDRELYLGRLQTLIAHSGARAVITFDEFRDELGALLADVDCQVLSTAEVPAAAHFDLDSTAWQEHNGEKIAFLQHSSGTTGLQKGVALSHQAVLNQIEAYGQAIELNPDDVVVSWLPLYHDMGLIAGFVMPIVSGVPLVLMSPFQWVRDPKILLWAIHKHKGTLCWLPNFAYNHLARTTRPRFMEGIDLSSWRAVINCSEPVYEHSQRVLLEKLGEYGLQTENLAACYAMAENTFAVTQTTLGTAPRIDWIDVAAFQEERRAMPSDQKENGAVAMVSCGKAIEGTEVAIAGQNGERLPERSIGEIIIRSNCMLSSYYGRPEITAEAIREGWYFTGDMGYLADGELFVSGRKKDLIIVGGKNIYPQDLEAIANHIPGVYPGRAVAFGLYDQRIGSESIVMVCELQNEAKEEERQQIERQLREQIVLQTEITLADVRLVEKRWLIKTSSGKIARGDNRAKYIKEFRA